MGLTSKSSSIRILLVEDFHAETEVVLRELRESELDFDCRTANSETSFLEHISSFAPDVILSPYSIKGTNAVKLFQLARQHQVEAPFILLAFDLSEDIAIDLLSDGIEDYVQRSTLKRLSVAIRKALSRHKTQLELMISEARLRASEESLRQAQKIAKVGSWEWDVQSQTVWWSDEMYRIYETDVRSISLDEVRSFIHPEDRQRVESVTSHDLSEKITPVIEYRILLRSGTVKHVVSSADQILDKNGNVVRLIGTLQDVTEKVLAFEKLEAERIQRELTIQAAQIGVWHWELGSNELRWDQRCFEIYGIPEQQLSTQNFIEYTHPDDRPTVHEKISEAFASGLYNAEYRICANNVVKYLHARGKVTYNKNGEPVRMDGVILDMTERHEIEDALRQSEQLLRLGEELSKSGSYAMDIKTGAISWSDNLYCITGFAVNTSIDNQKFFDCIHPDDKEAYSKAFQNFLETGNPIPFQYRFIRPDNGKEIHLRVESSRIEDVDADGTRIIGSVQDVTEQVSRAEQVQTLSLVASETVNGVLIHEADGTVIWANKGFERITGYSLDEMVGSEPWSILAGPATDMRLVEMTYQKLQDGKSFRSENQLRHKNGQTVWVSVSFTPILDEFGNVTKVVSIGMDITKNKETEQLQRDMLRKLEKANSELKKRTGG
ncbi:MAG: hypothetical protein RL266_503 [Bacteroidota bacterium]|jgi:PAS domain S-box-containing protein